MASLVESYHLNPAARKAEIAQMSQSQADAVYRAARDRLLTNDLTADDRHIALVEMLASQRTIMLANGQNPDETAFTKPLGTYDSARMDDVINFEHASNARFQEDIERTRQSDPTKADEMQLHLNQVMQAQAEAIERGEALQAQTAQAQVDETAKAYIAKAERSHELRNATIADYKLRGMDQADAEELAGPIERYKI